MPQSSTSRTVRLPLVEVSDRLSREIIQSRWEDVAKLLQVAEMSGLQMQLDSTLHVLAEKSLEIVPADLIVTCFWNDEQESMRVQRSSALAEDLNKIFECDNPLTRWLLEDGRPVLAAAGLNPESDGFLDRLGMQSCLATPIFVNGRVMGSWQRFSRSPGAFTGEDAQLLWAFSRISENLLSREFASRGLIRFAFTDHLTGLKTRGFFEQQLDLEVKRFDRSQVPFSLLMLDIDHFKALNDRFGHTVGDNVLRQIGETLMQDMRDIDTVARYGGEEFVIILPDTSEDDALLAAERIRASVELRRFRIEEGLQTLSISIGVAVFGVDTREKQELVQRADAALYKAKDMGRNRVVRFRPDVQQQNA